MEQTYFVFSLRTNAWLTPIGNYTSDRTKAMKLTRQEALEICRTHKLQGKITALPISEDDLNDLG